MPWAGPGKQTREINTAATTKRSRGRPQKTTSSATTPFMSTGEKKKVVSHRQRPKPTSQFDGEFGVTASQPTSSGLRNTFSISGCSQFEGQSLLEKATNLEEKNGGSGSKAKGASKRK
ncbi:unnamed protein product [Cuscuta epithymum]|uniref:Uncharacterized protein n=1 Tax=Cuscuta epithymum TaxID=186058 RepID=A0AAV0FT10_9ASTE|nr:unnamed protein product [Cuscuta epithymum]